GPGSESTGRARGRREVTSPAACCSGSAGASRKPARGRLPPSSAPGGCSRSPSPPACSSASSCNRGWSEPPSRPRKALTRGCQSCKGLRCCDRCDHDLCRGGVIAVEVEIDVELLKREIKKTYASVSEQPET